MGNIGKIKPSLSPARLVKKHEDKGEMIRQLRYVMDDWEKNKRKNATTRPNNLNNLETLSPQLNTNSQM